MRRLQVVTSSVIVVVLILITVMLYTPNLQTTNTKIVQTDENSTKIKVVASFYPMYEFAKNVGGNKAEVSVFVPIGTEPHDWEPRISDMLNLKTAQVFVYNGAGMEPFVEKLMKSGEYRNVRFVETIQGLELIKAKDAGKEDAQQFARDPHTWLDPVLVKHQVIMIKEALIGADPDNALYYEDNAINYLSKLDALDSKIKMGLSNCQKNTFIPFHDAYAYFAKRYGLNIISLTGMIPESQPTPGKVKELIDFIKENEIKVIFEEEMVDPQLANVLAKETGTKVMVFSPIEGLSKTELENGITYIDRMEENLKNLKVALECS